MNQKLERFEPLEVSGRLAYEHLHRYAICRDHVAGRRVLDVACGTGYGTNILAQAAAEATGMDIDASAIRRAKRKYRRANLKFVTADCYEMPFEGQSFDMVVANEMIEHIEDHDRFVEEVRRVLRPGGAFFVSTPNKPIYNRYKPPNAFHVSEMDIPEFRDLLEVHFEHVRFVGLRMALVSAGFDLDGGKHSSNLAAAKTYRGAVADKGRPTITNDDLALEDPEYVLAICSDKPVEADSISSTIFFSSEDDLWLEHERVMAWASQLHGEDEVLRADLAKVRSELDEAKEALESADRVQSTSGHLEIASRLLTRLTGNQVDAESASMIEAMFVLNERIVTQRAQLQSLAELQTKASRLEHQLETARIAQDRLAGEVRRAEAEIVDLRQQSERALEERAELVRELDSSREKVEKFDREIEELKRSAENYKSELDSWRESAEKFGREIEELKRSAESYKSEAEKRISSFEAELKKSDAALGEAKRAQEHGRQKKIVPTPRPDPVAPAVSAQQRRYDRLVSSHRNVREQLARSKDAVRGSIPVAVPARLSRFRRLIGSRPTHRSRLFNREWIARQVPDAGVVSLSEFLADTRFHRVDPHPLFAASDYLDRNPDVAESGLSPLEHYLDHGWREGRNPHPYFANDWYLQQYPDVLKAGTNPLEHYLEYGWREGRRPNPVFNPTAYLSRHPDVRAEGTEPLTHYVMHGKAESREIPFAGLERDWRSLIRDVRADSLMDLMLSEAIAETSIAPTKERDGDDASWPPRALNDFWIPQSLRDFLLQRGWERHVPLLTYLYSVMDAYASEPAKFPSSDACRIILDQARALSGQCRAKDKGVPSASVIIPVYNNVLDTLLCIVCLLEMRPEASFEIIVADDCSDDATADLVPQIGGIVRHLRYEKNGGFLENCNVAAREARGRTIVLLNNDTLPLPGWLEGLLSPFERIQDVGLVGSKLINWDGRLQEAGGIFWKDGSAWNFGRGQNPLDPEFNYLKDVDYCSGASIAVPTELWRDLGGFDPAYSPAYCEDSDIAFRIRDRGLRTLYSPESEVIHHEGRSHGRDTGSGIKAYQVLNQERLIDRWGSVLERDHYINGEQVLRARDRSFGKPHILVVDHYVPQVDKDAGSRTMFQFLEALVASGWAVTFWPENLHYDPDYTPRLQGMGVEVIYGSTYSAKFSDFLRARASLYDAVLLSRPHVAIHFVGDVRSLTDAKILYYGHDIHFERMKAQREVAQTTIEEGAVEAMKVLELGLCNQCDVVLYPSTEEAKLMGSLVSDEVIASAIPAYRFDEDDLDRAERAADSIDLNAERSACLLFVGGFAHGPNVDGTVWFCQEIAPILRGAGLKFELQIAGSNPTADIWDLEADDVHVLGFVSDEKLQSLYREADVVIAPLRFGAGVKGKVVEAMASGVPVVTTQAGAQGLAGADDYLFLGDTPEEFAAAVQAAMDSDVARAKVRAAVAYVRAHYSRTAMIDVLREVLPSVTSVSKAA